MRKNGFTLVEALVGSLILAIGAVVICGLSYRCMINNKRGIEYEQACRLLDECLDTVAAGRLEELIRTKRIEDDFGDRHPNYSFVLEATQVEDSQLQRVKATVRWMVGKEQYQVQATTLIYPLEKREETKIAKQFTVHGLQFTARTRDSLIDGN
jgi:prepilin-type N-terminal cleavage/methylation domain-containing protein